MNTNFVLKKKLLTSGAANVIGNDHWAFISSVYGIPQATSKFLLWLTVVPAILFVHRLVVR